MGTESNTAWAARERSLPLYDAEQLTKGGQQAQILLNDQLYTLRITRQGKLLLTK
ncbi:MAG: hemin uptake protein HemP [Pseudomonadota bacterium]